MTLNDTWFGVTSSKNNKPVIVRGRQFLSNFIETGDYVESIEVTWSFREQTENGIPTTDENLLMQEVENSLIKSLESDLHSILTIVHTCDNERTWIFYTKSTDEFMNRLNDTLATYDEVPISIESDADPDWELYKGILKNNKLDLR